jgi:hypothetical protein
MALTIAYTGTLTDPAAGGWRTVMTAIPGTAVYAAAFDFSAYDGVAMNVSWRVALAGEWVTVWATTVTVDTAEPVPPVNGITGLLTPPVPVLSAGELRFGFATGPATGVIPYEIYRL